MSCEKIALAEHKGISFLLIHVCAVVLEYVRWVGALLDLDKNEIVINERRSDSPSAGFYKAVHLVIDSRTVESWPMRHRNWCTASANQNTSSLRVCHCNQVRDQVKVFLSTGGIEGSLLLEVLSFGPL